MLVNLNDVLRPARAGKYGVGLFNAVNLEMAKGVLQAAEEKSVSCYYWYSGGVAEYSYIGRNSRYASAYGKTSICACGAAF